MLINIALLLSLSASEPSKPNTAAAEFHQLANTANPPIVSVQQVAKWQKAKQVVLVDLRRAEEFAHSHLQGAINIPATDITDENLARLIPDRQSKIVTYCGDTLYPTRRIAVTSMASTMFVQHGYTKVFVLEELYSAKTCKTKPPQLGQPCPAHLLMVDQDGKPIR